MHGATPLSKGFLPVAVPPALSVKQSACAKLLAVKQQQQRQRCVSLALILAGACAIGLVVAHRVGGLRLPLHHSHAHASLSAVRSHDSVVHCYFLLDSTGSMSGIRDETIEGFNTYVKEQQGNAGTMKLSLITFSQCHPFEQLLVSKDIHEVTPLTRADYQTSCGTPLFDAIAQTIDMAEKTAGDEKDVIVVVMTDGGENASREHDRKSVFARVEQMKKERGWTFVFLGANQDSFAAGGAIGVDRAATTNWKSDGARFGGSGAGAAGTGSPPFPPGRGARKCRRVRRRRRRGTCARSAAR